jgi:hypothetical protein
MKMPKALILQVSAQTLTDLSGAALLPCDRVSVGLRTRERNVDHDHQPERRDPGRANLLAGASQAKNEPKTKPIEPNEANHILPPHFQVLTSRTPLEVTLSESISTNVRVFQNEANAKPTPSVVHLAGFQGAAGSAVLLLARFAPAVHA